MIQRAIDLKPDDYYVIDSMGWVLYRIGRHQEALQHLRRAYELSEDPEVAAHLGEVLWVMGEHAEAREIWETALKVTPGDENLLEVIERPHPLSPTTQVTCRRQRPAGLHRPRSTCFCTCLAAVPTVITICRPYSSFWILQTGYSWSRAVTASSGAHGLSTGLRRPRI